MPGDLLEMTSYFAVHHVFTNLTNVDVGSSQHPRHNRLFLYLIQHWLFSTHSQITRAEPWRWKWPEQASGPTTWSRPVSLAHVLVIAGRLLTYSDGCERKLSTF